MGVNENPDGELSVLSFDTDRIKKYVFATSKLKEIRGASALLDNLNCEKVPKIIRDRCSGQVEEPVVYAAGGSCIAIVPHSDAKEIMDLVENLYPMETVSATITGASFQTDKTTVENRFGLIIKELRRMLQKKKAAKYFCVAGGIPGYVKFCESCNMYPAQEFDGAENTWLCGSCYVKRKETGTKRRGFWDRFIANAEPSKYDGVKRLNTLDQMSQADNYMGYIYCDGNNMGKLVDSLSTPQEFSLFAHETDSLIERVAMQAIDKFVKPVGPDNDQVMPFEVFLMGGDDLIMAVPAVVALEITVSICKRFEEGARDILKKINRPAFSLSMGAGVVLGPVKYPFHYFNRLAEQLLKSAKLKCAKTGISGGVIDYQVINGGGFVDLNDIRKHQLAYTGHDNMPISLTQRPYFIGDIEKLLNNRDKLKRIKFPRSRLNILYDGLFIGRIAATLGTAMALSRSKDEQADVFRTFLQEFDAHMVMPWTRDNEGGYCTPLGDLVEIYDI